MKATLASRFKFGLRCSECQRDELQSVAITVFGHSLDPIGSRLGRCVDSLGRPSTAVAGILSAPISFAREAPSWNNGPSNCRGSEKPFVGFFHERKTGAFPNLAADDQVDSMSQVSANFKSTIATAKRNKRNFG
jgi:hypothetical protein